MTKKYTIGKYDAIFVRCPHCSNSNEFKSKSGECEMNNYTLNDCPNYVLIDINRDGECECNCGVNYKIDTKERKIIITKFPSKEISVEDIISFLSRSETIAEWKGRMSVIKNFDYSIYQKIKDNERFIIDMIINKEMKNVLALFV